MKQTFSFLKKLKDHNEREWFEEHRSEYENALKEVKELNAAVQEGMQRIDQLDLKRSRIYRIYNDIRFHPGKSPYKIHFAMNFIRQKPELRGGYYLHVSPGDSFIAAGFWDPEPADLLHIRQQISQDPEPLRKVLSAKTFSSYFGALRGDRVKTSPKGFSQEDPAIDLIRFKQLLVSHPFTDREVLEHDFSGKVVDGFSKVRPFFDYMTEILTTDLNGVPLLS